MKSQPIGPPAPLCSLVESAKVLMSEKGYAQKTVENYATIWKKLLGYAQSVEGITAYSPELIASFAQSSYGIEDVFHPTTDKQKQRSRMLLSLHDFSVMGDWPTRRTYELPRQLQSQVLRKAHDDYVDHLNGKNLSPKSISLKQCILKHFLLFAETEQIQTPAELSQAAVADYLERRRASSSATRDNIIVTLRGFFRYMYEAGLISRDLSVNLKASNNWRFEHLPSTYSTDEIRSLLSAINRTNPLGKKDYAVILLAADTGMRISDIFNLKLSNLKWDAEVIEIVQKKTGEFLRVGMSRSLKWALLDYLMHVRPMNTTFENVFLRYLAPVTPYTSAAAFYIRLNRYFEAAGINTQDKHSGMHCLRHSLASRLLHNDVPITVISEALGHRHANVTKQYIRIDIPKLRLAALEVPSNG